MEENLIQKAIKNALCCNWEEAIEVNEEIIKNNKTDTEALNRLARAYYEIGKIKKAKEITQSVLRIDSTDKIATNALIRYKLGKPTKSKQFNDFIEEPGKTKITTLINLGSEKIYSKLISGDEVYLIPYTHKLSVVTNSKKYIGRLTDDLAARLRKLIKGGNKYKVIIKASIKNCVKVLIKEISRGKGLEWVQSFPIEQSETLSELDS